MKTDKKTEVNKHLVKFDPKDEEEDITKSMSTLILGNNNVQAAK
jgi:hypothetical protein